MLLQMLDEHNMQPFFVFEISLAFGLEIKIEHHANCKLFVRENVNVHEKITYIEQRK